PCADDVARALVAGLLVRTEPGAAEVLCSTETAERLLPGLGPTGGIWQVAGLDQAAQAVEAERVARSRRFEAAGAADATQFRTENPENPLPLLLVVLDPVPLQAIGRWSALLADAPRLAIAIVFLARQAVASTQLATGRLAVDATHRVLAATPREHLGTLVGAELFGLSAEEAVEVLGAREDTARAGDPNEEVVPAFDSADGADAPAESRDDREEEGTWPQPEPIPPGGSAKQAGDRSIVVRVLGHFEVTVAGEAVVTGLRSRARDVLAWFLLRPEGATSDEAVEALWPDTEPDRVHGRFWRSFSDLRTRLREAGGAGLEVLTKAGEHYRPAAAEIACDLWDFQGALGDAARTADGEQARAALVRAVASYRGELLAGVDRPWVEPVRQDLHRRALDAHLRLAELEDQAGRTSAAVQALERAIDLDRYAEEPYRRLMALHAGHGRPDAVTSVWRLLQGRL
ncbi:MAG: AfsR/SARP family transcriptional regulator, partial [Acidimicrobiales bacterium]